MDSVQYWIGIFLRPRSSSIHTHWPLEPLDGRPAVTHLFARLKRAFADASTVVLGVAGHAGGPNAQIAEALRPYEVESHLSSLGSPIEILAELSGRARNIVLYPDTSVFPDCILSREMMSYHDSEHADATVCDDVPPGLTPVIYRAETILRIANLGIPGDVSEDCLAIMRNANELLGELSERPFAIKSFPLSAAYRSLVTLLPAKVLVSNYSSHLATESVVKSDVTSLADYHPALEMKKQLAVLSQFPPCTARPPDNTRRTILFATNFASYSGGEESFYQLIRRLEPTRYRPIALVPYEGVLSEKLRQAGIDVEVAYNNLDMLHPDAFRYFAKLLQSSQARILHINVSAGIPLLVTALNLGIPIVTHVRTLYGRSAPAWHNCSQAVVAISNTVKHDLIRSGIEDRLITTIYNGIDSNEFNIQGLDVAACKAAAGVAQRKTVLMVARICPQKRQQLMVEAAAILRRKIPDVMVLFVGQAGPLDQPYASRTASLVRKLGLENNVQFLGFRKRLQELYAASDAVVLCTDEEPFGRCVLEALAMRVPVVVPRSGGHAEVLSDGETCVQYQAGDAQNLAERLESVLCDGTISQRLAENGERLAKQLSIESHVQQICELYEKLLAHGANRF
jgi:glycosyltransferase involved in cell wall biosynthesis